MKTLSLFVLAIFVLVVLAGCSGDINSPTPMPTNTSVTQINQTIEGLCERTADYIFRESKYNLDKITLGCTDVLKTLENRNINYDKFHTEIIEAGNAIVNQWDGYNASYDILLGNKKVGTSTIPIESGKWSGGQAARILDGFICQQLNMFLVEEKVSVSPINCEF